ncbi:MAG TPA: NUDIX domain-containing protein [Candidatus Saccharimonadales bacterium]|nr:NUDIX domain-containing protein [Candidatus Saccharimonadales bacterium]
MASPPIPVVTCTIYYKNKFLVIRRHDAAKKFGGLWGFPGGKIEQGETVAGALAREVAEETGLVLTDQVLFVDSYFYGDSLGLHFTAFATSARVTTEPGVEHRWLSSLAELQALPRIPGIDFHIAHTEALLKQSGPQLSLRGVNYTPDIYIN